MPAAGAGGGAVSRMNCSIAAEMAAASSGVAAPPRSSMRGRLGRCFPLRATAVEGYLRRSSLYGQAVADLLVFPHDTVLRAIPPAVAIERVRDGFVEHAGGDWQMPPKTYLDASPNGDFRAMPAKGAGIAILKWVTSFPRNPEAGLPVVMGAICVSSAADGELLALVDVRAVTALRTGAVAAVAAQELARGDARTAGIVGCGLHGAWAARCLADAEYGPGVCFDPDPDAAGQLGRRAGLGGREPRRRPVLRRGDVRHARCPAGDHRGRPSSRHPPQHARAPTARARPRPSRPRWRRASSSATSGPRPATGASSPEPSRPGS